MKWLLLTLLVTAMEKTVIDRVILTVDNRAYTLFDLKKDCILSNLIKNREDGWRSCEQEEFLLERFPAFMEKVLLYQIAERDSRIQPAEDELEKAVDEFVKKNGGEEGFKALFKKTGLKMRDIVEWTRVTLIVNSYVEKRLRGKEEIMKEHLDAIRKTVKIRTFLTDEGRIH